MQKAVWMKQTNCRVEGVRPNPSSSGGKNGESVYFTKINRRKNLAKNQKLASARYVRLIPVAARTKAWVCGRSLAGFMGSNPAGGTDVCFL